VLEHHPDYRDNPIAYGGTDEPTEDRPYTIEGGDVVILSKDAVLIGASERTRSATIERLAEKCFQYGHMRRVYEVPIPAERAFMHLDTVFTVIDRGMILWFSPVMSQIPYVHRYEPVESDESVVAQRMPERRTFLEILRDEFRTEMTVAWKAGDTVRRDALRLLIAALENARIEAGRPLEDTDTIRVLQKEAKQRRDSITEYDRAGRSDLSAKEQQELDVITTFLPTQLSDEEIRELARGVIAETGASGAGDVGKIMRPLIAKVAGRADGGRVNQIARELLGG